MLLLAVAPTSIDPLRLDQLICVRCGVQYDETDRDKRTHCPICEDFREAVLPTGQTWTTLNEMYKTPSLTSLAGNGETNWQIEIAEDPKEPDIVFLNAAPRVAIGQCPFIIKTPHGLVIWEVVSYIDQPTIDAVKAMGEVKGIAISHPHFYGPLLTWSEAFDNCPIYLPSVDKSWLQMEDKRNVIRYYENEVEIVPGCRVVQLGGHFPGSAVLIYQEKLFVADTLMPTPSSLNHRPAGSPSFTFLRSVINFMPLPPSELIRMWPLIKKLDFTTVYGAKPVYPGCQIIRDSEMDDRERREGETVKFKIMDSMRVQIRAMGYEITPDMGLDGY